MFFGYCFDAQGFHTPATKLLTAGDAFKYCLHWHHEWHEVRITDEEDYCVMHVVNHILIVPYPNDELRLLNLADPAVVDIISKNY